MLTWLEPSLPKIGPAANQRARVARHLSLSSLAVDGLQLAGRNPYPLLELSPGAYPLEWQSIFKDNLANGPNGSWVGHNPRTPGSWWPYVPAPTGPVVYFLFGDRLRLAYIGATLDFRKRLRQHARRKAFSTWQAVACTAADRFLIETRLIHHYRPPLNRVGVA